MNYVVDIDEYEGVSYYFNGDTAVWAIEECNGLYNVARNYRSISFNRRFTRVSVRRRYYVSTKHNLAVL